MPPPAERRRRLSLGVIPPFLVLAVVVGSLAVGLKLLLLAPVPVPTASAVLSTIVTTVEVNGPGSVGFRLAREEQVLVTGDDVRTSDYGRGMITFSNLDALFLEPGSQLRIRAPVTRGGGLVHRFTQSFGASWSQFTSIAGGGGGRYEIETSAGVVSIRDGAVIRIGVGRGSRGEDVVSVIVLEGSATFATTRHPESPVEIEAGQMVTVEEGQEALPAAETYVSRNEIDITLHSPFWMLVFEPGTGLATGMLPPGVALSQIELSTTSSGEPQTVALHEVAQGTYTIYLIPKGTEGGFSVDAIGRAGEDQRFADAASGTAAKCDWYVLYLHVTLEENGDIASGYLEGPFFADRLPIVTGRQAQGDCPAPAPRRAEVQAAVVESPTPVPPTPEPPTPVPPTPVVIEPTAEPPTAVPPTAVPPTSVPPSTPEPTPFIIEPPTGGPGGPDIGIGPAGSSVADGGWPALLSGVFALALLGGARLLATTRRRDEES